MCRAASDQGPEEAHQNFQETLKSKLDFIHFTFEAKLYKPELFDDKVKVDVISTTGTREVTGMDGHPKIFDPRLGEVSLTMQPTVLSLRLITFNPIQNNPVDD